MIKLIRALNRALGIGRRYENVSWGKPHPISTHSTQWANWQRTNVPRQ